MGRWRRPYPGRALMMRQSGERQKRARGGHCYFSLRALAARKSLQVVDLGRRYAAAKPAIHVNRSINGVGYDRVADKPDRGFYNLAHAALFYTYNIPIVAAHYVLPKRSFIADCQETSTPHPTKARFRGLVLDKHERIIDDRGCT